MPDPEFPPAGWRERCDCAACALWREERRLAISGPAWPCLALQEKSLRAGALNALGLLAALALAGMLLYEVLR